MNTITNNILETMNNKKSEIFYYSLLSQKICLSIFSDETMAAELPLLSFKI